MTSAERNEKWWATAFAWVEASQASKKAHARTVAAQRKARHSDRLLLALLVLAGMLLAIQLEHLRKANGLTHSDKVQLMRLIDRSN